MRPITFGLLILVLSACASRPPTANRVLLDYLSNEMTFQYHECVPLGWAPVPVAGTYVEGYSATLGGYDEFLDAIWRGRIETSTLHKRDVFVVFNVLNHLVYAGLLARSDRADGYDYFLTWNAVPYFYASSRYSNNRGSKPYLCYSTVVPDRIAWVQRLHIEKTLSVHVSQLQEFIISFEWKPSPRADWANDQFLRSHSVILAPITSPTTAKLYYLHAQWHLLSIYGRGCMSPAPSRSGMWPTWPMIQDERSVRIGPDRIHAELMPTDRVTVVHKESFGGTRCASHARGTRIVVSKCTLGR